MPPSNYVNVSTPRQSVMALFDEHQLGIRNLAGSADGVVNERKGIVVALGDERWRRHLGEGEWLKVDLI